METFDFYQDILVSMWQRQYFSIEAESEDEAKKKAMEFVNKDVAYSLNVESENLYDTEECVKVDGAHPDRTIQLFVDGEKEPFATNAIRADKSMYTNQYKSIKEKVKDWLNGVAYKFTRQLKGVTYHVFEENDKLCIVVDCDGSQATKYLFPESWYDIVANNMIFRKKMMDFIFEKNTDENNVFSVHDWLCGYLTDVTNVPFTIEEFIKVWGKNACQYLANVEPLVGYQIINDNGEMPEGLFSFQVIKSKDVAKKWLAEAKEKEPEKKGLFMHPIYQGDIENPTFI